MRKLIILTATGLMIAASVPARASSDDAWCGQTSGPQLSVEQITAKAAGLGYEVRGVERDDGCYEIHAVDKNGARVELKMHPVTGRVVKSERKS